MSGARRELMSGLACLHGAAQFLSCPGEDVLDRACKDLDNEADTVRQPGHAAARDVSHELASDEHFNP